MFDLDPTVTSYEAKCKLLPHQIHNSHISNDQFCWPFSVPSPTTPVPPSSSSSQADSPLSHQSSNGHNTGSDQKSQLIVTIHRRGYLNPNVEFVVTIPCHERSLTLCFGFRMCQNIHFVHPPDLSTRSSPSPVSVSLPQAPPELVSLPQGPPVVLSWKEKEFPPILLRGVMFGQSLVEVECKVSNIYQIMISPRLSLPRSSLHPYVITLYYFCLRSLTHGILRFLTL